jgi:predicted negative regulator of RcsB-dependent stress response
VSSDARDKGDSFLRKGDFDAAVSAYTDAIQFNPAEEK